MQLSLDLVATRWRHGRSLYRPQQEPIDTEQFSVEAIDFTLARAFVEAHHYSGTMPAAIRQYGLFMRTRLFQVRLCGVIVFSVPMNGAVIRVRSGLDVEGCEIGRIVLLDAADDVPVGGNAESYFIRRAIRLLAIDKPALAVAIAFSDPVPRRDQEGRPTFRGHYGGIYQASSARYVGRSTARSLLVDRAGRSISDRLLSKIRNEDRGIDYALRRLQDGGAPARNSGEPGAAYLKRALAGDGFTRLRHPGNHAYVLPLGDTATRRKLSRQLPVGLPYPKTTDPSGAGHLARSAQ